MDLDFDDVHVNQNNTVEDNYYQQYCRLFLANIVLTNQIKELIEEKDNLKFRLGKYEDEQCMSSYERNQKAKRFRRNAHQIERFYKCTVKTCGKSYGSEGSLNQHYKLKHPQIYLTLPNVQPTLQAEAEDKEKSQNKSPVKNFILNSNPKLNCILKQLGEGVSFKSMRIQQFWEYEQMMENKTNKQNICMNIQQKYEQIHNTELNNFSKKPQIVSWARNEQNSIEQKHLKLKRSSRIIKKRDLKF